LAGTGGWNDANRKGEAAATTVIGTCSLTDKKNYRVNGKLMPGHGACGQSPQNSTREAEPSRERGRRDVLTFNPIRGCAIQFVDATTPDCIGGYSPSITSWLSPVKLITLEAASTAVWKIENTRFDGCKRDDW